jgi:hypothetical protein
MDERFVKDLDFLLMNVKLSFFIQQKPTHGDNTHSRTTAGLP